MSDRIEEGVPVRDESSWAKLVSRLERPDVAAGAININVGGKRLASPIQGFGRMWQKTYRVRIPSSKVTAPELISVWKARFPDFWPVGNRFYGPLAGIAPGEIGVINATLPGRMKLSTGVLVIYADEESFTLMTPQGHMFAGWVTFSAAAEGDDTVAQVQVLMRASDPIFELGLALGGHRQEDVLWQSTLASLAARFGLEAEVETKVVCVDRKRQWSRWRNVWQSSAIRSTLYMLGAPVRAIRRKR
jgi:hypothetical protein